MSRDIMIVPIQIKSVKESDQDNYIIELMAAVYNNIDLGRDKIFPGAFSQSIRNKGDQRPILWQHQMSEPIGKGIFADTTKGLACKAMLPKNDDFVRGRVMPQVSIGSIQGASIGYETIEAEFDSISKCRNLKVLELWETSLVTIPMNPLSQILSVTKAAEYMGLGEFKGIDKNMKNYINQLMEGLENNSNSIKLLPTMDDTVVWDEKKALKEIKDNNGTLECFVGNIPIAYFDENKFKAVPKGLYAATAKVIGLPIENKNEIKARLNKYYTKLGKDFPFKESGKSLIDVDTLKFMSRKQIIGILEGDDSIEMTGKALSFIADCFKGSLKENSGSIQNNNQGAKDFMKEFLSLKEAFKII